MKSMSSLQDRRVEPSEVSPEILRQIEDLVHSRNGASLIGPDGQPVPLPEALNDLLLFVVEAMQRNQAILFIPEDEAFTTQAAANYLGMSRPFLLRLLEAGKLPYHRVGTHRRIMFRDLVAFKEERTRERNKGLSDLTRMLDEEGVYDRPLESET
jgi:excisionase family DNA binding protein